MRTVTQATVTALVSEYEQVSIADAHVPGDCQCMTIGIDLCMEANVHGLTIFKTTEVYRRTVVLTDGTSYGATHSWFGHSAAI